jgi:LysM repeat protein
MRILAVHSVLLMKLISFLFFYCLALLSWSQADKSPREQYIHDWKDEAVYQMVMHRIPASITLAQGILESGDGKSRLATEANNHFGIKCHTDWTGPKIFEDDDAKSECFRKYNDAKASYEDHSLFLQRNRYASLFDLKTDDYKAWASGLKQCGYATNPKYPELLIKLIEEFELHQYDAIGMQHLKNGTVPDRTNAPLAIIPAPKTKDKGRSKNEREDRKEINLGGRQIEVSSNRIKFIKAKAGDTPEKIANDLGLNPWQLKKYNDLTSLETTLEVGEVIYLQPKRNRGAESTYVIAKGDYLRRISQKTGVKIKALKKYNPNIDWDHIQPGQSVKLRK